MYAAILARLSMETDITNDAGDERLGNKNADDGLDGEVVKLPCRYPLDSTMALICDISTAVATSSIEIRG